LKLLNSEWKMDMKKKGLAELIRNKSRVTEVLARNRKSTLKMIGTYTKS
jgi:antitoxin component HigA of HigAB toxin-antitoxin module